MSFVNDILKMSESQNRRRLNETSLNITYKSWESLCINHYKDLYTPWIEDYRMFLKDVGEAPDKHFELRRIDPKLKFQQGNVHWVNTLTDEPYADRKPYNNRRTAKTIDWEGVNYTVEEFAIKFGITAHAVYWRMRKWPKKDWAGRVP